MAANRIYVRPPILGWVPIIAGCLIALFFSLARSGPAEAQQVQIIDSGYYKEAEPLIGEMKRFLASWMCIEERWLDDFKRRANAVSDDLNTGIAALRKVNRVNPADPFTGGPYRASISIGGRYLGEIAVLIEKLSKLPRCKQPEADRKLYQVGTLRKRPGPADLPREVGLLNRPPAGPRTEAASFVFEPQISFGITGSSGTSSYDSTGGQAPFNGDWSHSTGQVCGGATFYPGFVIGPARVGLDVNVCSGSNTFGSGDTTLFAIMRHGPGDVVLRSSTNVVIDTLFKAEVPLGDPQAVYDPRTNSWFLSVGIGPSFREQNLTLTSDQSFFGGGVPSISATTWQSGFVVSTGISTFVCPTCIAGNPLKVGIEGRARFFPSQSNSLHSIAFAFEERGSTGSTTDYSAQVTLSVPMGYGPALMTGSH
jgi:hypothetical protein